MRRGMTMAALLVALVAGGVQQTEAGVRAGVDGRGQYRGLKASLDSPSSGLWSGATRGARRLLLNPRGDQVGDLWPTVAESSINPNHPWAVWSRHNGEDYDLVWSRWSGRGWDPAQSLADGVTESFGDDVDADLQFNRKGRPYTTWWREDDGSGRVYMSIFLRTRWMTPFAISVFGRDARHPTIERIFGNRVLIQYEVHHGDETEIIEQWVVFHRPLTITDDINPLVHLEAKEPIQVR